MMIILIVQHRFQFIYLPSGDATCYIVFLHLLKAVAKQVAEAVAEH